MSGEVSKQAEAIADQLRVEHADCPGCHLSKISVEDVQEILDLARPTPDQELREHATQVVLYWTDWPQSKRDGVASLSRFLAGAIQTLAIHIRAGNTS